MDPIITGTLAKPALQVVTRLLKPLIDNLEHKASKEAQHAYHRIFNSYASYLEQSFERHSYFNSIVFKNEQKKLTDYYLPLTIIKKPIDEEIKLDIYPKELIEKTRKVLIVDTAGMGKTTLLKYLFLGCVTSKAGIPIYIELRKLTEKKLILDFILEQLSDIEGKCRADLLFKLMKSGEFVLFLDGYDEIPEIERAKVTASLQELIEKAPKNKYIITSREENGLVSFPQFQRYIIRPLEKEEAYTLLKKYADNKLSEKLITKLEQPENKAIHEFLTNPLLTSLLYKSFEYKQLIPLKRHIFYRQIFEALYETHDLTKEGGEYNRTKKCGLDIDKFEDILRSIGALSYRKKQLEYTKTELLELIDEAKKLSSEKNAISSNILHDLTHAVPLMVEDGNYIRWNHRSIQEYFAARYICKDTKGKQNQILLDFIQKPDFMSHLNLILLCADIDRAAFRQSIAKWIAETLLDEFNSLYTIGFEDVSKELIQERKELIVGKAAFFIRVQLPDDSYLEAQNHAIIIAEAIKPIEMKLEGERYRFMQLRNPGVCICDTKVSRIIESLHEVTDLPFIETFKPEECTVEDSIEQKVIFQKINGNPLNPVNEPRNFLLTNCLLKSVDIWKLNSKTAQDFLQTLNEESKAQDELIKW